MKTPQTLKILFLSSIIVLGLKALTNSIDTHKNAWDFLYYIALAKDGFDAVPLASPFAYRYMTPFLVHGLSLLGMTIEQGFSLIAYFGAIAQLIGIFFFVDWLTKSRKGAYLAMVITAFSLYNVKFLLFDIYRPDHLAYILILTQTYLAFKRKFTVLLFTTIIASQIREFNIIPLIAYLFMIMQDEDRNLFIAQAVTSAIFLLPAILIPRILIPVTENFQIVGLSNDKLVTTMLLPFFSSTDVNFIFSIVAYLLPLLFIADPKSIISTFRNLPEFQQRYLMAYIFLVLILTFFGGTDLFRFVTFLFLPQIILIGVIAPKTSNIQNGLMLISVVVFNRLWAYFPDWDIEKYRDFYGGFSLRLNMSTLYRILECALFLILGYAVRKQQNKFQNT